MYNNTGEQNLSPLLIFIPIQNSKSLAKTWILSSGTPVFIPKKTRLQLLTLHSPFCLFLIKVL